MLYLHKNHRAVKKKTHFSKPPQCCASVYPISRHVQIFAWYCDFQQNRPFSSTLLPWQVQTEPCISQFRDLLYNLSSRASHLPSLQLHLQTALHQAGFCYGMYKLHVSSRHCWPFPQVFSPISLKSQSLPSPSGAQKSPRFSHLSPWESFPNKLLGRSIFFWSYVLFCKIARRKLFSDRKIVYLPWQISRQF